MFEEVYSKIEDYCNYRIGTGYSGFSAKKGIKKFLDYCLKIFQTKQQSQKIWWIVG